jgi:hypothetical protein
MNRHHHVFQRCRVLLWIEEEKMTPDNHEDRAVQHNETEDDETPGLAQDGEKRGGLKPEEFQKRLVFVTATVLILGVVGGTCLGSKIRQAERAQEMRAESGNDSVQMTPAERAKRNDERQQR